MTEIRIRNWNLFQHYKDRNPPWIKLHYDLLSSKDWVLLDDASKLLAVVCMLVASRNDGYVPNDPEFIQRVAYLKKKVDLKPLLECGFLEVDASDRKRMLADDTTEERREEERQRKGEIPFEVFWEMYPNHRNPKKAETKWKGLTVKNQKLAMEALPNHVAHWDNPRFVPYATTWINQERWLDEIPEAHESPSNLAREISARAKQLDAPFGAVKAYYDERGSLPVEKEQLDE
jgi:hypothetical protein